jgi:hypothetical protein
LNDATLKARVPGLVDHTHPTTTELLDDAVMRDGLAEHLQECYGVRSGMSMYGLTAASRTPLWLPSGWECRGRRFAGVRASALAADRSSPDCFAGANTIRATPMMTSAATPSSSPRGIRLRNACTAISADVGEARPCRESNEAAIRRWVTGCQQQENAECDIKAKHHRQRRPLPHKHRQGIN